MGVVVGCGDKVGSDSPSGIGVGEVGTLKKKKLSSNKGLALGITTLLPEVFMGDGVGLGDGELLSIVGVSGEAGVCCGCSEGSVSSFLSLSDGCDVLEFSVV